MNIEKLVDFLYSSDDAAEVPFRISLCRGQYAGWDLNKEQCLRLLYFLNDQKNYNKEEFSGFLEEDIDD